MQKLLSDILGTGDGDGNTSNTRILVTIVVLLTFLNKLIPAWLSKQPAILDGNDIAMIGLAFGARAIHNHQEAKADATAAATGQPTKEPTHANENPVKTGP